MRRADCTCCDKFALLLRMERPGMKTGAAPSAAPASALAHCPAASPTLFFHGAQ
jgi:hypothetical protein